MFRITYRAARVNAGLTLREAAAKIGCCPDTLSRYETGKSVPSVGVVSRMCDVYNTPVELMLFS